MGTLNHVGVSHLFLVPNIRTSKYLNLLAEACPEIANSTKDNIQAEKLPQLKVGGSANTYHDSLLTFKPNSTSWLWTTFTMRGSSKQSWTAVNLQ